MEIELRYYEACPNNLSTTTYWLSLYLTIQKIGHIIFCKQKHLLFRLIAFQAVKPLRVELKRAVNPVRMQTIICDVSLATHEQ